MWLLGPLEEQSVLLTPEPQGEDLKAHAHNDTPTPNKATPPNSATPWAKHMQTITEWNPGRWW